MYVPQWLQDFIKETFQRWKMKRPKYFVYLSRFWDVIMMLTGLPYLLVQSGLILAAFDIKVTWPGFVLWLSNKLIAGIAVGFSVGSRLTVRSTVVAQTTEGNAVTVMDKTNMPFTEKSEAKEIAETKPPPPVVTEVPEPQEIPNRE